MNKKYFTEEEKKLTKKMKNKKYYNKHKKERKEYLEKYWNEGTQDLIIYCS